LVVSRSAGFAQFCAACVDKRFAFDRARAGAEYSGALRTAVLRHKFQSDAGVTALLREALLRAAGAPGWEETIAEARRDGALVTVPMHSWKRWSRGWDSVHELSRAVSSALDLSILPALRKVRRTPPQIALSRQARSKNLSGAFALRRGVQVPPCVILIDDVITTGTTASRCARVLKRGGALHVAVLAVARS
jgi:ComF family protein